ncbi:hypothetical protein [Nocardia sp. MW-W600-9]
MTPVKIGYLLLGRGRLPYPPAAHGYARDLAVLEQSAARALTPALYATLCLDDDPERACRRLRAGIERYYNAPLAAVETIQTLFAGTPAAAARLARRLRRRPARTTW